MANVTIRVIRHGETEANIGKFRGRDSKLTANGISQSKYLEGEYDLVICSTLWRTRQTLMNSRLKYKQVIFLDEIREVKDNNSDNYQRWEEMTPESNHEFHDRLVKFHTMIQTWSKLYNKICIISHGVTLRKLTGYWFKNAYWMAYNLDGWNKLKIN